MSRALDFDTQAEALLERALRAADGGANETAQTLALMSIASSLSIIATIAADADQEARS